MRRLRLAKMALLNFNRWERTARAPTSTSEGEPNHRRPAKSVFDMAWKRCFWNKAKAINWKPGATETEYRCLSKSKPP
jgi:hypothetical protein